MSYNVVSAIHQSVDSARHVIKRILQPHFLSYMTSDDVVSAMH